MGPLAEFTRTPRLIVHGEVLALAERPTNGFEALWWNLALPQTDYSDALTKLLLGGAVQARLTRFLPRSLLQWLHVPLHQVAWLNFLKKVFQRHQRQHFGGFEP